MNYFDIWLTKVMIRRLIKLYGSPCDTMDYEDMPEEYGDHRLNQHSRCAGCQSSEVVEWLRDTHLDLLEWK
jgi:hypothetical protein